MSPKTKTLLIPNAHASAVTGLTLLSVSEKENTYRFASVGNDQRLKTWGVSLDVTRDGVEGLQVERVADVYTGVADAAGLEWV